MCISIFPCPTEKNFKIFQPEDQDPGDVLQLVLLLLHALWHRPQLARTYRCRQISILLYQNEQVASVEARLTQSLLSTGTLFISFLIAAILDVPGKLLALVACVRIPSNAFVVLVAKNHSHFHSPSSSRHGWVGDSRTSASTALPGSSSSSTASFRGTFFECTLVVHWKKSLLELNLSSRGENIDKMPVVVISMISRCQSPKVIYPALPKIIFLVLPSYFSASACPPPSPCSGCGLQS